MYFGDFGVFWVLSCGIGDLGCFLGFFVILGGLWGFGWFSSVLGLGCWACLRFVGMVYWLALVGLGFVLGVEVSDLRVVLGCLTFADSRICFGTGFGACTFWWLVCCLCV